MPSFSQTQWTSCKRWSLKWAALTGTQLCTVFGYKDLFGSTVLGALESVGMNGQVDWRAQQISHLVCSLAGQKCSEAWETFWTWTEHWSQHWLPEGKKSGERKQLTLHPPMSRKICIQPDKYWHCVEGDLGETVERWGGARVGRPSATMPSWAETDKILEPFYMTFSGMTVPMDHKVSRKAKLLGFIFLHSSQLIRMQLDVMCWHNLNWKSWNQFRLNTSLIKGNCCIFTDCMKKRLTFGVHSDVCDLIKCW